MRTIETFYPTSFDGESYLSSLKAFSFSHCASTTLTELQFVSCSEHAIHYQYGCRLDRDTVWWVCSFRSTP